MKTLYSQSIVRSESVRARDLCAAVRQPGAAFALVAAFICAVAAALPARASEENDAVAISSRASADYVRPVHSDGTPAPETFAFAKGGLWKTVEAGTHDDLDFMKVARTIAVPLASQHYVASTDPKTTRLLIMVYWGTTRVPDHATNSIATQNLQAATQAVMAANIDAHMVHFNPGDSCAPMEMQQGSQVNSAVRTPDQISMENAMSGAMAMASAEDDQRVQLDKENAMMLGYDSWWAETARYKNTPQQYRQEDLLGELEGRRYFVVLMAYDFQKIWKEKKAKLLWETRFSVRERGDDFGKRLAAMAASASPYFGKDSGKLIHTPLPEGHVEVGPLKNLAFMDSK
jgi:hypothetical protein